MSARPERRWLLRLAALAIAAPARVLAQGAVPNATPGNATPGNATPGNATQITAPIRQFYAQLLAVMQAGRAAPFTQRFDTLAPALEQALNVPAILRSAVGLGWSGFPPSQQADLLAAFRRYTVASWVSNFDSYSGQRLEVGDIRPLPGGEIVNTRIIRSSGPPSVIDFVMRQAGDVWKATDVLLDGTISQVAVLRSDFRALVAQGAMALAANLKQKTTELMGGTAPL